MSLVSTPELYYPNLAHRISDGWTTPVANTAAANLTASGQKAAFLFQWPAAANGTVVKTVRFVCGTVTTAGNVQVSLQTVSSGAPTGTNYGGSTTTAGVSISTSGAEVVVTLATGATITGGDLCALVIAPDTGFAGSLYVLSYGSAAGAAARAGASYGLLYNGATWGTSSPSLALVAFQDGSANYVSFGGVYYSGWSSTVYNSGSASTEYGLQITVPFACRIAGISAVLWPSNGASLQFGLYNGTTLLAGTTLDASQTPNFEYQFKMLFASPHVAAAGDTLIAAVLAQNTTNARYYYLIVPASGQAAANGMGAGAQQMARSGGAWTATATQLPFMSLVLDQLNDGANAGGVIASRVFTGF